MDGGDTEMNEETPGSGQSTVKKPKTSAPVPPDDFVVDRIKALNGSPCYEGVIVTCYNQVKKPR